MASSTSVPPVRSAAEDLKTDAGAGEEENESTVALLHQLVLRLACIQLSRRGDFELAHQLFKTAYEHSQDPNMLCNSSLAALQQGICSFRLLIWNRQ